MGDWVNESFPKPDPFFSHWQNQSSQRKLDLTDEEYYHHHLLCCTSFKSKNKYTYTHIFLTNRHNWILPLSEHIYLEKMYNTSNFFLSLLCRKCRAEGIAIK